MTVEAGTLIDGRYRVERPLGEGSMAEVYVVTHAQLGTEHALKVLKLEHDSIRQRMMREGQFQAKLRHPNIVNVSDVVPMDEGATGLVMELIDGGTLQDLLHTHRLNDEQVDVLARGILDGVEAAHDAGLIHRDLKPANILLAREGKRVVPKIADFGLAKALDNSNTLTKSGVMMGTPAYMAPEQIHDAKRVDQRADLFSVGAILYHMVAGRRPFDDSNIANVLTAVMDGDYPPLAEVAPTLAPHRMRAIEAALEVEVDDRVENCAKLRAMWSGEALLPAPDSETTEGPFGRDILDSLAKVPKDDISQLETVIRVPEVEERPAPPPPPKVPRPEVRRAPPSARPDSMAAVLIGAVGILLLLALATVTGFGIGSAVLLWIQS